MAVGVYAALSGLSRPALMSPDRPLSRAGSLPQGSVVDFSVMHHQIPCRSEPARDGRDSVYE
ncbi:hypothetical protein C1X35_00255 [Pseudomonas sp. FW306-1C-G01A]|nr:hypothetical protein C1X51_28705 [Pseudomonas sp. FW306-2-2C-B10A]PMV87956.1 hypothetical protein C1X56_09255 [Pseudomonas sp. GW101-1A09]PMV99984.1 hypothetical protein C1X55_10845 [Pseudomonas sp. GW460-C8]PMW06937.1 hypothetical protein C1X50_06665 [Pseudomonas sp. MPR-TSA4]PMW09266.1 hypothetical protein C1X52_26190 [Pseudomonas sp. FW306-2-1A-C05A]PMW23965.1 hypothetical protein C1X53_10735 [Pseudomonas sp. GW456-E6]PMW24501.1 hypothetical protein C1X40_03805 [Pseudomonas sp. GW456-11